MSAYAPQSSNSTAAGGQWIPVGRFDTGGHLMLSAILSLIFISIAITIHLYIRYRRQYGTNQTVDILLPRPLPQAAASKGLEAAAIAMLPTFPYRRLENSKGDVECAVCLCVAEEGEMLRMLPECKHLFHVDCIDMWLYSHSTCPVCRGKAKAVAVKFEFGEMVAAPRFPERGGSGVGVLMEGSSESQRRWVGLMDGERDLERQ